MPGIGRSGTRLQAGHDNAGYATRNERDYGHATKGDATRGQRLPSTCDQIRIMPTNSDKEARAAASWMTALSMVFSPMNIERT